MMMKEISAMVARNIQDRQEIVQQLERLMAESRDPNFLAFISMSKILFNISIAAIRHGEEIYGVLESFKLLGDAARCPYEIAAVTELMKKLMGAGLEAEKELDRVQEEMYAAMKGRFDATQN